MDAQKVRIEALSGVLQDFEHINNAMKRTMDAMKLVIDTASDPAALQREQAYKARVDRDVEDFKKDYAKQVAEESTQDIALVRQKHEEIIGALAGLLGSMTPFVPPDRRMMYLASVNLDPTLNDRLQALMRDAPYIYEPLFTSMAVRTRGPGYAFLSMVGGAFISEPILPSNEPQEGTPSQN